MALQIFIDYRTVDSQQWKTTEFSLEEYFDLSLDENIEWNSVPEYNHAVEYLDINSELVTHTRIRINDSNLGTMRTITTTFWNQGRNFIIKRVDNKLKTSCCYNLLVTNTLIHERPLVREIMRFREIEGILELEFHSFVKDNEDGSQAERIVFPVSVIADHVV